MRVGGPPGLSGALLVVRVWKLCRNPSGSNRGSRLQFPRVHMLCRNPMDSVESLCLSTLGDVGVSACRDHSCFHASDLGNLSIIVSYPITSLMLFVHLHIIW
jgi:hypothetical protein